MYTSSGLKQTSKGEFYMQVTNTVTGEVKDVPVVMPIKDVEVFDLRTAKGHKWVSVKGGKFIPEICHNIKCSVCASPTKLEVTLLDNSGNCF